jgi:hypothetical protein
MNITKNLGMLLLAIYLIVVGIVGLGVVTIPSLHIVVAILALAAGILILIGK